MLQRAMRPHGAKHRMSVPLQTPGQLGTDETTGPDDENFHRKSSFATLLKSAIISGSCASIASTLMVTLFSKRNDGAPASGTNAASQWVWGRKAKEQRGVSARYTLLGFAIHHASSLFWAT